MATPKPDYYGIDFREQPEKYRVSVGEMGVLTAMPYKSEILPFWRFKNPDMARESSEKIYQLFLDYKASNDFIGMDMARKFLQMGYTRSRRYANHNSGQKYKGPVPDDKKGQSGAHGREQLPREVDYVKEASAQVFYEYWQQAKNDVDYQEMAKEHRLKYED